MSVPCSLSRVKSTQKYLHNAGTYDLPITLIKWAFKVLNYNHSLFAERSRRNRHAKRNFGFSVRCTPHQIGFPFGAVIHSTAYPRKRANATAESLSPIIMISPPIWILAAVIARGQKNVCEMRWHKNGNGDISKRFSIIATTRGNGVALTLSLFMNLWWT